MDTDTLEVFRAVARLGSLTAAAVELAYTQSAVSRQIAALEVEFGARLFDRLPRGVTLTEEGRLLLDHSAAVLDRLAAARADLEHLRTLQTGWLRVGAFPTAMAALVPRALADFRAEHPSVRTSVVEGLTPSLLERVADGSADVAVVSAAADDAIDATRFDLHHLMDERMLVAVPRTHRLARRRVVRLTEFADEAFIAGSFEPEHTLLRATLPSGFRPRIDIVCAEWTGKFGCVAAGLGVALIPALAVRGTPSDLALLRLHRDDESVRRIHAVTAAGRTAPPAVPAFLALLRKTAHALRR
ncbi:MAG TPA: LysR family transcriptional regulator [Micromonosporaceae bacterium]|jgi:DNA-binding transcriptional LysR family regulator